MRERVGECSVCHKPLYCLDGFFNGIKKENGEVICFDCDEPDEEVKNES